MFTGKKPTDHMFSDGSNLHKFVKTALAQRVTEITDSRLLQGDTDYAKENVKLLSLIFEIGIAYSAEVPRDQIDVSDVASELLSIRDRLLASETSESFLLCYGLQ
ncbi:putative non-specific serine/threonine protein kinase [Rosa chinensis]|uniref:Putative non-specific serine/threonine protein kinase n=1 Tax=Rosa chinensis TaxID=74649 RepID=A0A2P6SHG1_ROSCH|nr:putative non-specific serine/threonine protein kinase [Rosa chinensis]